METQAQTASADHRHPGNMAQHVQQLQQTGFDDSQVRALASFVSDMAQETMRPFVESMGQRLDDMQLRADQRHAELSQRLGDMQKYVDQQFDGVNQRLGDTQHHMGQHFDMMNQRFGDMQQQMNQRVDRVETRLDHLEQHTRRLGEGLAGLDAKVEGLDAKVESGRRREWIALTVMGLGFVSIVVAILLATGFIG